MDTTENKALFQQETDLEIIGQLIPYLEEKTFLDIGAAKGEFVKYFTNHNLKGVLFEPLPICAKVLSELAEQTQCAFYSYAIDCEDREAEFYQAYDNLHNSTEHFSSLHKLQNDQRISHKEVCKVQCRTLNSLMHEKVISQKIGIVKIDTEGNDLNVLKGMDQVKAEILICEFFMPDIYMGWELGQPNGLIQQAKMLGFNHFIAIKRIGELEIISIDDHSFVNKQWGNLIFLSDRIYHQADTVIHTYLKKTNSYFMNDFLIKYAEIQNICDERLSVIVGLKQTCDARLALIEELNNCLDNFRKHPVRVLIQTLFVKVKQSILAKG